MVGRLIGSYALRSIRAENALRAVATVASALVLVTIFAQVTVIHCVDRIFSRDSLIRWANAVVNYLPVAIHSVTIRSAVASAINTFAHSPIAVVAIVFCGLFNSVMWPCIFPLSVKGLGKLTSQGSGILVMMVVGGAVIPEIQGLLADKFGYQHSFVIVLFCYAYLVYFALSGYRIQQPRYASLPEYVPPIEI